MSYCVGQEAVDAGLIRWVKASNSSELMVGAEISMVMANDGVVRVIFVGDLAQISVDI